MPRTRRPSLPIHAPPGARVWSDPDLAALAARAIDAARGAGATYADVRLTETHTHGFQGPFFFRDDISRGVGVRALVGGTWGFMSSTLWTADEVTRLARGAVEQARANGKGITQTVEVGTIPVATGSWTMPVKYDPFDIPTGEKLDFMNDAGAFVETCMSAGFLASSMTFVRQDKVFASTEGSAWQQRTYQSQGSFVVTYRDQYSLSLPGAIALDDKLSVAGQGWEYFSESGLIDRIPALVDEAEQARHIVPVNIGAFDAVFSASAMAALLDATLGTATELDRALGEEANAGGSSYLSDPLENVGQRVVANPIVTIVGDRSTPGAAATVKWDDESVLPEPFTIVKNGVLTDYQTTRAQASILAPYYTKTGQPVRSHGCAGSDSALHCTMQHAPNLQLVPSTQATTFDDLVAQTKSGVAIMRLQLNMDQQQSNGTAYPTLRKIVDGKLGPLIGGAGLTFSSNDLWKNVTALGGAATQQWFGFERKKGEPEQSSVHSVGAVPARVSNVRIIDLARRA